MHIPAQPHVSVPCASSCQAPAGASLIQSHVCLPARALCLRLPSHGTWAGGFQSTSPSSGDHLPGGAEGGRQGCRAALRAGWPTELLLLLSRLQGDPWALPYLPFPTAFLGFLCFSPPSTLHISLGRTWHGLLRKPWRRLTVLQGLAQASCSRLGHQPQQQTASAPSAWATLKT